MSPFLQRVLAFTAVSAAFAWMIRAAPNPQDAALREFNVFVPLTLLLGIAGLARAFRDAWRFGWRRRDTEGLAAFSFLALAWGHDASRAAVRRAAQISGYEDAIWLDVSDYRLFSGGLIVLGALLVLRWATRHEFAASWRWPEYLAPEVAGELPWAAFAVFWMLFMAYQTDTIVRILTWFYTMLV